jgi:hypothetical protein
MRKLTTGFKAWGTGRKIALIYIKLVPVQWRDFGK